VSKKFVDQAKLKIKPLESDDLSVLFAVNGGKLHVLGLADIEFYISGLCIPHTVYVVENIGETLILGSDFLRRNQVNVDYKFGLVTICDDLIRLPLQSNNKRESVVRTVKSTTLLPYSESIISVSSSVNLPDCDVILEPIPGEQFKKFAVARSLCHTKANQTVCRILNLQPNAIVLPRGTSVATINTINVSKECTPFIEGKRTAKEPSKDEKDEFVTKMTSDDLENFAREYGFKINPKLTSDQRTELLNLLFDYRSVFARSMRDIKGYPDFELELEVVNDRPSFQKQYKWRPDDAREAQSQIDEMFEHGLIEKSNSVEWNVPLFLISKRNTGKKRLIADLRRTNAAIAPRLVQLPNINELLDEVASVKPKYLSSFDLFSGYYQIKLAKKSRDMCSFTSPNGIRYRYKICPFGLNVSPSAMVSVLMHVMSRLVASKQAYIYMDDILTAAKDWPDMITNIRDTLETLKQNQLVCNPEKCVFAVNQIQYLGFEVGPDGIRVSNDKVKIIKALQPPKDKKSLQRTLGFFNFWRRFVPHYAKRSFHMRSLLHNDTEYKWSKECQEEWQYIKDTLSSAPVLAPIDPNKDFVVFCDGSSHGLGWAVLQFSDDDGLLHPISYGAQACTAAQHKWTASALEICALACALRSFEQYMVHKTVTVLSDNISVLHLQKLQLASARERRLGAYLMQFRLSIRYVRGVHNNTADLLSRCFTDFTDEQKVEFLPKADIEDFVFTVSDKQQQQCSDMQDVLVQDEGRENDWRMYTFLPTPSQTAGDVIAGLNPNANVFVPKSERSDETAAAPTDTDVIQLDVSLADTAREVTEPLGFDGLTMPGDCTEGNQYPESDCANANVFATRARRRQPQVPTPTSGMPTSSDLDTNVDDDAKNDDVEHVLSVPPMEPSDFANDVEFGDMWRYLTTNELTDDEKRDRRTLLLADQFFVEDNCLYRLTLPRARREARVRPINKRLCIPNKFRNDLMTYHHERLGHWATDRLYLNLSQQVYWKNLYQDTHEFCQTCDTCLRSKINFGKRTVPLHPFEASNQPFQTWQIDHKTLTRPTAAGNVAVLCMIDSFSKWPIFRAVPDYTSLTTAKVIFEDIVSVFGASAIISDKGSSFTGDVFRHLSKLMGVQLTTSASKAARTNGECENLVKMLSQGLKLYAKDDKQIEDVLPVIAMGLRSTAHSVTKISPYEVVFAKQMNVNTPGQPIATPPFKGEARDYYFWMSNRLKEIHEGVKQNILEAKLDDKTRYDKRHHAVTPQWQVGQQVLLEDKRITTGSNKVVSHRPFDCGPFVIVDIVQGRDGVGVAYKLIHAQSGRSMKKLVTSDRLKLYTAHDRVEFNARNPKPPTTSGQPGQRNTDVTSDGGDTQTQNATATASSQSQPAVNDDSNKTIYEPAVKILRQRTNNGKKEFLVLFANKEKAWADQVTPALLEYFRICQNKQRNKRRKRGY